LSLGLLIAGKLWKHRTTPQKLTYRDAGSLAPRWRKAEERLKQRHTYRAISSAYFTVLLLITFRFYVSAAMRLKVMLLHDSRQLLRVIQCSSAAAAAAAAQYQ